MVSPANFARRAAESLTYSSSYLERCLPWKRPGKTQPVPIQNL